MKVSGFLSELLIADLAAVRGVAFKYPDRLTRQEVQDTLAWAQGAPEIAAALRAGRASADYKAVMLYKAALDHFATEHPQDASGEPAAWPARSEQRGEATPEKPFGNLFPDEAEALLAWAPTSREYVAAYHDKAHPNHAAAVERSHALREITAAAATEGAAAAEPAASEAVIASGATQARLAELRANPAYLDKNHPDHQAAVDAVTRVYQGEAAASAAPARSGAAAALTPQQRIDAARQSPAYWNKGDPGHAAALDEATAAYAAAHPAPAEQGA